MSDAIINKTQVQINVSNVQNSMFLAKGQVVQFDGFLKVQRELSSINKKDIILPNLKESELVNPTRFTAKEKSSKAPSRFTEASLVKKLEELGIGRPSTYAPTISTIQKREYVELGDVEGVKKQHVQFILENKKITETIVDEFVGSEKKKLLPTEIGKITNDFLVDNFSDILDFNFTAKVEDEFDNIAAGKKEWIHVIDHFYKQFAPRVLEVDKNSSKVTGLRELGVDPITQKTVYARLGKFGPIVQLGDIVEGEEKPKYAKLLRGQTIESVDLKSALELFSLPRNVGVLEDKEIIVSEGKYGPYIRYNGKFISLSDHNPLTVNLSTCVQIIKDKEDFEKQRLINTFECEDGPIEVLNGRYGPYIKKEGKNYKIPKDTDPKKLTQVDCLNLIQKSTKK